jgi:8-oxo-dGTP pyrophosphatase MutT (NUDIX family)
MDAKLPTFFSRKKPMSKFSIIAQAHLSPLDLIVKYNPEISFSIDNRYLSLADTIWRERTEYATAKQIRFYNGYLYNLLDTAFDEKTGRLTLTIGRCRYYDYVVTRTRKICDNQDKPVFADPLAICCAVITIDSKILIGKRIGVDGSIDKYHVVGGFIEQNKDNPGGLPCPFEAMRREIREEVGIDIDDIVCTGLIYDQTAPHPELCFYAKSSLTFAEIVKCQPADIEVISWLSIDDNPETLAGYIKANFDNIAVPGLANLIFYGKYKYGDSWSRELI